MIKETQKLLSVKVPVPVWDAMQEVVDSKGLSRSDQVRVALMAYLGISDLREPFVLPVKDFAVTQE